MYYVFRKEDYVLGDSVSHNKQTWIHFGGVEHNLRQIFKNLKKDYVLGDSVSHNKSVPGIILTVLCVFTSNKSFT